MWRTLAEGAGPVGRGWGAPTTDCRGAGTPSHGPQGVLRPGATHQMYTRASGGRAGGREAGEAAAHGKE